MSIEFTENITSEEVLLSHVHQHISGKTLPISRLGFFTSPFVADHGPLIGLVVKVYKGIRDAETVHRLKYLHNRYVEALRTLGVSVPITIAGAVRHKELHYLVIVQQPFQRHELLREVIVSGDQSHCIKVFRATLEVIWDFWNRIANHRSGDKPIGIHASLRNFAFRNDSLLYYLDTFPPMIDLSVIELHKIMALYSGTILKLYSLLDPLRLANNVTAEYFLREQSLLGFIGSVCRIRPELCPLVLKTASDFISEQNTYIGEGAFLNLLTSPPRLSLRWRFMSRLAKITSKGQ